jgi:hypothetical protein
MGKTIPFFLCFFLYAIPNLTVAMVRLTLATTGDYYGDYYFFRTN